MNIGFVGAGEQGLQNLIPALSQIDGTRIAGICDLSRERADRAGARCGGVRSFASVTDMLDAKFAGAQLDAVVAASYPQVHIDLANEAILRKIPVFVEKPSCYNRAKLVLLVDNAAKAGVQTGVGLNFRFASVIQRLQDLIAASVFDGVYYVATDIGLDTRRVKAGYDCRGAPVEARCSVMGEYGIEG